MESEAEQVQPETVQLDVNDLLTEYQLQISQLSNQVAAANAQIRMLTRQLAEANAKPAPTKRTNKPPK